MNKLFDTHTHYDDNAYGNTAHELIGRILSENVAGFIAVGCSFERIPQSIELAERYETVYSSIGIHPHYITSELAFDSSALEKWAKHPKVVAIGETGLDYHYEGFNREMQIKAFRKQLKLAEKLRLPAIIHSRDAASDTLEILKETTAPCVVHCFSGSVEMARELVKRGILISFTGVVTFKNARKSAEVCREIPLEMLMLETDCPYMSPEPFRGKICDSSMAWYTAAKIAEIKGVPTNEVVAVCNNNAKKFFNI